MLNDNSNDIKIHKGLSMCHTVFEMLCIPTLTHSIPTTTLWGVYYYFCCFTDDRIEAESGACAKAHTCRQ